MFRHALVTSVCVLAALVSCNEKPTTTTKTSAVRFPSTCAVLPDGELVVHAAVDIAFRTPDGQQHRKRELYDFDCRPDRKIGTVVPCDAVRVDVDGLAGDGALIAEDVHLLGNVSLTQQGDRNFLIRHGRANVFTVDLVNKTFTVGEENPSTVLGQTSCDRDALSLGPRPTGL